MLKAFEKIQTCDFIKTMSVLSITIFPAASIGTCRVNAKYLFVEWIKVKVIKLMNKCWYTS